MKDALRELIVAAWLLVAAVAPALAVQPDEMLADPALEARARTLSQELRCMVCQNQTIDESDAPLARDLRLLVRERLKSGDTDQQVLDFLVQRYGDFVLLKPPFKWDTALLWLVSPLLLLVGAAGLWPLVRRARKGAAVVAVAPLTAEEDGRLRAMLAADEVSQSVGSKTSSA
jgi:cytochrome c-type biogenesis protein CcmH